MQNSLDEHSINVNDDDSDGTQLSARTLQALAEFYAEKNSTDKCTIDEDWQLSQFWYSEETAKKLVEECINCLGEKGGRIACISCPTLIGYFKQYDCVTSGNVKVTLFEYDRRFFDRFPDEFVFYDYREPLNLPNSCLCAFDLIIIDPPFLSDECLIKVARTIQFLSSSESETKLLICTGLIMAELVQKLFHVHICKFQPSHQRNLGNEFACFANFKTTIL